MTDFLDADELPQDRVDELADWLHTNNIGICELDDDIVYNDATSMRALAERLLQHGPDGIRITKANPTPSTGDHDTTRVAELEAAHTQLVAELQQRIEREVALTRERDQLREALTLLESALSGDAADDDADDSVSLRRAVIRARSVLSRCRRSGRPAAQEAPAEPASRYRDPHVEQVLGQEEVQRQRPDTAGEAGEPPAPRVWTDFRTGERATATDDSGRVVTGFIDLFFAWDDDLGRHRRARLLLDDGTTVAVDRTSLTELVSGVPSDTALSEGGGTDG